VLVSLDGFRWDYLALPEAVALRRVAAAGVRAVRMEPVFPSKTFPNHYSQVTGLFPEHTGIVSNTMEDPVLGRFRISDTVAVRDRRWWGGEPLWVTVERQGFRAASFFWPGSEADIGGVRPTWYQRFDNEVPNETRVRQVLDWLAMPADQRPRFITAYFSDVDGAGHRFGPGAPETRAAVARVDSAIGALWDGIVRLGARDRVTLIVVADHGMTPISPDRQVFLDDWLDPGSYHVVEWSPVAMIAPTPGREAEVVNGLRRAPHLAVFRKADLPDRWRLKGHPRVPEIVAVADEGWRITTRARFAGAPEFAFGGDHGYDNILPSMGALFVAAGPGIARGREVPRVRAVDLYALMAHILGLVPAPNDGSLDSVRAVLR